MIIDNEGQPSGSRPTQGKVAADFRVQTYHGKPVLTWWEGQLFVGDGDGVGQIYDSSYKRIAHGPRRQRLLVRPARVHDHAAQHRARALLRALQARPDARGAARRTRGSSTTSSRRSTSRPGSCSSSGTASATSRPTSPTSRRPSAPGFEWEYFHANSAERRPRRQLPRSPPATPRRSTRSTAPRARSCGAWAARSPTSSSARACASTGSTAPARSPTARYKLYDNSAAPPVRKNSRVLTLKLDEQAKTATLVSAFTHPRELLSASQGNVETLPNGNTFVGWGSQRCFTEFDARPARSSSTAASPAATTTTARSATRGSARPAHAAEGRRRQPAAATSPRRVSWNGATEVARWELLGGADADALAPVGSDGLRTGFETAVTATSAPALVALRAYDAAGNVLVTSAPVKPARRSAPGFAGAGGLLGGELAAGRVDVAAARQPHGGAQAVLLERGLEGVDRVARADRRRPSRSGCTGSG